jgi:NAD(P)-dependent dehydrogenase (short-subunit alcohol dehydrogenase family)
MAQHSPVVVVTGASAGVGRAVVREYAQRGARIGLLARGRAGLDAARQEALHLGAADALAIPTDVGDPDQVERAAQRVEDAFGAPDVWVNNAMNSVFAKFTDITADEFRRVTEVTYLGQVYGTMAALRRMLPQGHGRIVLVGSALAYRGIPLQSAYCGAKHGIQGFFDSLRSELLHEGTKVTVSMVNLPALNTPQFSWVRTRLPRHPQPVPPIFQPEVAARAVVWAGDHGVRELNVGGPTWMTVIANKVAPGLLDRYLAKKGFKSQQTQEPIDASTWEDNLERPVDDDEDFGAHGVLDLKARPFSKLLWASTHKRQLALAGAAAGVAGKLIFGRDGED